MCWRCRRISPGLRPPAALPVRRISSCLASKRAKALNAGFDDVFDSARMSPEEAEARCSAILARYRAAADSWLRRNPWR